MLDHLLAPIRKRPLVFELARNDFRARYKGSLLGTTWAFVQPVLTILLYLFIYKVGFRGGSPQNVPFVLWLIVGIAPWFFFTETMMTTTGSLLEYSFLVKKVLFDVSVIPTIKVVSACFIHVVVWAIVLVIVAANGYLPTLSWLQVPYYFLALFALVSGFGLVAASITPFFRDMGQVVAVALQFGFWLTPVLWPVSNAPARFVPYLQLNPVYYVVEGLREALFLGVPFWRHPGACAWFWAIVVGFNVLGSLMFKRLRPHLADVL